MQEARVEIASDEQDLARRMVRLFIRAADQAVGARGSFRTAFSGGRTPELFFRRLAAEPKAVPWARTHVFWVDERYVPPDSPASNYRLAAETLLNHVDIPPTQVYRIPTEHRLASDAARAYDRTIREAFGLPEGQTPQFDQILLGMGSDGHTASLFPGCPLECDADDLACVVRPGAGIQPQALRITLTPPVLLAARSLVVLVSGREKAGTLREVLMGESDEARHPIRMLWPVLDRITWLVDREAAAEIGEA